MDDLTTAPVTRESAIREKKSHWREAVLVCGKCSKKLGGGFGPRKRVRLAKALRKHLGVAKGRRGEIGFVEVGCFDVCPKKAVTVALGSRPQSLFVVPRGTPLDEIVERLGLKAP